MRDFTEWDSSSALLMAHLLSGKKMIAWIKNFDKTPKRFFISNTEDYIMINIYKLRIVYWKC